MKSGRSLMDLAVEIERQASTKRDYIADTRRLWMNTRVVDENGTERTKTVMGMDRGSEGNAEFGVLPLAHQQIGDKVGIPRRYYDRMLAESPRLLATNVNHWLVSDPEERMVRTLDGNVRAFLSERYRRLDNLQVVEAVLPALKEHDVRVESCEVTPTRLYLQCVCWEMEYAIQPHRHERAPGDVVKAGLLIRNSEVGLGSLSVQPLVYRLVCYNGLVVPDYGMRRNHVGRAQGSGEDEARELFTQETLEADDRAFFLKVRDTVSGVLQRDRFTEIIARMQSTTDREITRDVPEVVEAVQERLMLTEGERSGVLRHLIEGGDLSQWGLVNAVTAQANDVDSYDRAVALEADAWKLVELDDSQWRELASRN